jgi:hypothetical protein
MTVERPLAKADGLSGQAPDTWNFISMLQQPPLVYAEPGRCLRRRKKPVMLRVMAASTSAPRCATCRRRSTRASTGKRSSRDRSSKTSATLGRGVGVSGSRIDSLIPSLPARRSLSGTGSPRHSSAGGSCSSSGCLEDLSNTVGMWQPWRWRYWFADFQIERLSIQGTVHQPAVL